MLFASCRSLCLKVWLQVAIYVAFVLSVMAPRLVFLPFKRKNRLVLTTVSVSRCRTHKNVYIMLFSFWILQAITTYFFELHAGSSKKHPAEYIYLANGNSLRDVLRACESSPLDSLDKTIQSCIDPMLTRTRTNCLNCNGETFMLM